MNLLLNFYTSVRNKTIEICNKLHTEDFVVQPVDFVSPPKWHLSHVSWFFETFILSVCLPDYKFFNKNFTQMFNSYYQSLGNPFIRSQRGNLSRPLVEEIFDYTKYVNQKMEQLLKSGVNKEIENLVMLGLNHEQQHQELFSSGYALAVCRN